MAIGVAPSAATLAAITGPSSQITRRVEIYQSDAVTLFLPATDTAKRLVDGTVTVDGTRDERRAADLTLDNTDNALLFSSRGFWYDKIIKIYRGVTYTTPQGIPVSWETQIGEFMIDSISQDNFPPTMKMTLRDYTKKMLLSKFSQATTFVAGSTIESLMIGIAGSAGIVKMAIPVTGIVTNQDFVFDKGTTRWSAATQIATAYGYELFFDCQGYLTMRPFQDPSTIGPSIVFNTGKQGNLAKYTKSTNDSQLFNHVVVYGVSSNDAVLPPFYEVWNTEPSSPTRNNTFPGTPVVTGGIGDRLYEYDSQYATTLDQCQNLALTFLKVMALEAYNISLTSIVFSWLEANSVIAFIDPNPAPGDPTQFLLTSLTIPLKLDGMTANGSRLTIVSGSTF